MPKSVSSEPRIPCVSGPDGTLRDEALQGPPGLRRAFATKNEHASRYRVREFSTKRLSPDSLRATYATSATSVAA